MLEFAGRTIVFDHRQSITNFISRVKACVETGPMAMVDAACDAAPVLLIWAAALQGPGDS
jgi:hypothetical protein